MYVWPSETGSIAAEKSRAQPTQASLCATSSQTPKNIRRNPSDRPLNALASSGIRATWPPSGTFSICEGQPGIVTVFARIVAITSSQYSLKYCDLMYPLGAGGFD